MSFHSASPSGDILYNCNKILKNNSHGTYYLCQSLNYPVGNMVIADVVS